MRSKSRPTLWARSWARSEASRTTFLTLSQHTLWNSSRTKLAPGSSAHQLWFAINVSLEVSPYLSQSGTTRSFTIRSCWALFRITLQRPRLAHRSLLDVYSWVLLGIIFCYVLIFRSRRNKYKRGVSGKAQERSQAEEVTRRIVCKSKCDVKETVKETLRVLAFDPKHKPKTNPGVTY